MLPDFPVIFSVPEYMPIKLESFRKIGVQRFAVLPQTLKRFAKLGHNVSLSGVLKN